MSNRRKRKGGPKHVQLYEFMQKSAAWRDLSPVDRALYIELKRTFNGYNNGALGLSCREAAERLNVSKATAARAFETLQQHGFVAVAKLSGFNIKGRVSTEYRLTEYRCDVTGALATKEFMSWRPEIQSTVSPRARLVSPRAHTQVEKVVKYG